MKLLNFNQEIYYMLLSEAQEFANQIVEIIKPSCERIIVAGSIRRKKQQIRDVDIVLIAKPFLWSRIIVKLQRKMDAIVLKHGNQIAQLTINGINVDIYSTNTKQWEALLLIRTGSAQHNIKLSIQARKKGMKLTHNGLMKNGKIIESKEKKIFEALGIEFIPPAERN